VFGRPDGEDVVAVDRTPRPDQGVVVSREDRPGIRHQQLAGRCEAQSLPGPIDERLVAGELEPPDVGADSRLR